MSSYLALAGTTALASPPAGTAWLTRRDPPRRRIIEGSARLIPSPAGRAHDVFDFLRLVLWVLVVDGYLSVVG